MYKATREFIKARQLHTQYIVETVSVNQIGGLEKNECYSNAHSLTNRKDGIKIVSGWIIEPFDAYSKCTEIVQHWWNIDGNGNYFDTTLVNHEAEYVIDTGLADYVVDFYDEINSCVGYSMLLKDGIFYRVKIESRDIHFYSLSNLTTENFYLKNGKYLFAMDRSMSYSSHMFAKAA